MKFDAIQSSFTAGEFSPKMWGRVDLEKYVTGLAIIQNMIVQPHGGLEKRGGFHYVSEVKDSSKNTILINFNYKNQESYRLEFGDLYIRFYRNHEQIQVGGSPYEIETTYTENEVADLRICQDSDILYIVHKNHPPAKLTRTAFYSWVLEDIEFKTGELENYSSQTTLSSTILDNQWRSVCYSGELELFCAIADTGTNTRVMTSPNGVTWTVRWPATGNSWRAVCWSPELNLFCAVGISGTGNRVMTSPDGIDWTSRVSAADNYWNAVCWSPELELFCAVSSTGTSDRVMTSPDGLTWTSQTSAADNSWMGICWSLELKLFCAVSITGTGDRVMTSPDGITWTLRVSAADVNWHSVCWSTELLLFCAVAVEVSGDRIMTSPDGLTWTIRTSPASAGGWLSVCWSPKALLFCATANSVAGVGVMTSPDGITWTGKTPAANNMWDSVCWSPELELFCAVAMSGTGDRVMTSPDGTTWAVYSTIVANMWNDVCWSPALELFCAVATSGTDRVMTSPDGFMWTPHNVPSAAWDAVCWSSALNLFCAVASDAIMTSPDGVTWTSRTPPAAYALQWTSICWSPELALFCAVSNDAGAGGERMMTSSDGITWTLQSSVSPGLNWTSICWSPELSLFCAVSTGTPAGGCVVMHSVDGIDWLHSDAPETADWYSVCWSPKLMLFCAVALTSDVDGAKKIMISSDGNDWTLQSALTETGWSDVCWSPELEVFYAISRYKGGIITSSDGVNWILVKEIVDNLWEGVCWSPELLSFCSVATNSVGALGDQVCITKYSPPVLWQFGDYPSLTWFYEQRCFFAATPKELNAIWGSQSADFDNMSLGTGLDNEAIKFLTKAAYKFVWVAVGQDMLLGGSNAEFKVTANVANEVLTPSNIRPTSRTTYGGIFLPALRIDNKVIFVQKGGRKIRQLAPTEGLSSLQADVYKAEDLTLLSSHITKSGIINIVNTQVPQSIVWAALANGDLVGLTYEPSHNMYGWHKHVIGGTDVAVKSIVVRGAIEEESDDELWAVVERTINGSTVQYVEYLDSGLKDDEDIEDAFYVDSGITQVGSGFTVVTGLDHLEGEEVQILGDGIKHPAQTATGGSLTLATPVDKVHVGLGYDVDIETLPIEGGNPIGQSQNLIKRVKSVALRLDRSFGFSIGDVFGRLDVYPFTSGELFTGDTDPIPFAGGYDRQSRLKITQADPLPLNLLAIMYTARTK